MLINNVVCVYFYYLIEIFIFLWLRVFDINSKKVVFVNSLNY